MMARDRRSSCENAIREIWTAEEERGEPMRADELDPEELSALREDGLVEVREGLVRLTERGRQEGRQMMRRHRLAERLLSDVLGMDKSSIHAISCEFEHSVAPELEEKICTLLGHPRSCPHGRRIPEGNCCLQAKWVVESAVKPLSAMREGEEGEVVYISTLDPQVARKMTAMGILPRTPIRLVHKRPAYVFEVGLSTFAVDETIADAIFVRTKG